MLSFLKTFLPRLSLSLVGAGKAGVGDNTALSTTGVREGKTGEQVIGQAHGKYYEAASRGNLYAAGNATKRTTTTALGVSPPLLLYNPAGSAKYLSIKRVSFGQGESGTLGTGALFHCVFTINGPVATQSNTVPVVGSGAAVTPKNMRADLANNSVATVFELGTLSANPAPLALFANLSEVASGTVGGNHDTVIEDVDGAITLAPGSGWCLEGITAAGSTPTCYVGVMWEEIPIS